MRIRNFTRALSYFLTIFFFPFLLDAQNFTISGYIKDGRTDETLIGATVSSKDNPSVGTVSNNYGFYSLTTSKGKYTLIFSYIGYQNKEVIVDLSANQSLNASLSDGLSLQEIVVTAREKEQNVQGTQMGTVALSIESVKKLPALAGEVDILKTLQLLPGVKGNEGQAGFYVRGGGPDQNLVLLDEAVVYNPGHLLGFFSVFNSDAIKNTTLIKGAMPAQYGGRLSSVVDIQMKEGNNKEYGVEGGIGLIASRLTVEGPIEKDKSSFIFSARRTYALDLAQPFINQTKFAGSNYYFYDLNAKINYKLSEKDRFYLSGYFGRDVFAFVSKEQGFNFNLPYGNATASLRWNHVFDQKLFMNVSGIYNDYDFTAGGGQGDFVFKAFSGIRDWNAKADFDYYPDYRNSIKFGVNYTYHRLTPNIISATNGDQTFSNNLSPQFAHESAIYVGDDFKASKALSFNIGLRGALFNQLGPYTSTITGKVYATNEVVKTYPALEPRLAVKYSFDRENSVKASIAYTTQFLHLVSNSTSTLPADVWVPSSELVQPQTGVQYSTGYFKNLKDNMYETSIEVYYRDLNHQIDYPDNYVFGDKPLVEQSFVYGKGRAYGVELFIKKAKGNLTGWIGYTLSRTERQFPDIENGRVYPATYDRTHDLSVVANYRLSRKWEMGGAFVFATGNAFTPIKDLFLIEQKLNVEYAPRNSSRYEPYHRLDLAATYTPHPGSVKKFQSTWTFSVYNSYNRLNPYFIYYDVQNNLEKGTAKATAYQVTLFPLIPSVTWNFKWRQKKPAAIEKNPTF